MKLTIKALERINNSRSRMRLALATNVTEPWISKCIKANKQDGFLTKISVLNAIKSETGLTEKDILTEGDVSQDGQKSGIENKSKPKRISKHTNH